MAEKASTDISATWGATPITGIVDITPVGVNRETLDVTDLGDSSKQFIAAGAYELSEVTMSLNYDPVESGIHDTLIDDAMATASKVLAITYAATTTTHSCNAFVTAFTPSGAVQDKLSADVTFKPTGALTIS